MSYNVCLRCRFRNPGWWSDSTRATAIALELDRSLELKAALGVRGEETREPDPGYCRVHIQYLRQQLGGGLAVGGRKHTSAEHPLLLGERLQCPLDELTRQEECSDSLVGLPLPPFAVVARASCSDVSLTTKDAPASRSRSSHPTGDVGAFPGRTVAHAGDRGQPRGPRWSERDAHLLARQRTVTWRP